MAHFLSFDTSQCQFTHMSGGGGGGYVWPVHDDQPNQSNYISEGGCHTPDNLRLGLSMNFNEIVTVNCWIRPFLENNSFSGRGKTAMEERKAQEKTAL